MNIKTKIEMKDENEDVTNLQNESANKSDEYLEHDNVSEDLKGDEKAETDNEKNEVEDDNLTGDEHCKAKNIEPSAEEKYEALNDSYLRLIAEFDNFRKRTLREKAELIKSGGATVLTNLLPVVDDFERALDILQQTEDLTSAVEGVKLIYDKFISYLAQQGVKVMDAVGQKFDAEMFDAIAAIPAQEEGMKGKIVDCVQTGYMLYDKVLRHAKVVVGE